MNNLKLKLVIILICLGATTMLFGCGRRNTVNQAKYVTGGSNDKTDYNAPKVIDSNELTSFDTAFFRYGDYVYQKDCKYRFKMERSGDAYIITEVNKNLECKTDALFAEKLDKIIRDYNLIELNGINKETYGLAPEYSPYWLSARYASGEDLYFYMNGDPYAEWTWAVLNLFAVEFGNYGVEDLLPAKEDSDIVEFSLEYAYGDIRYVYGEILIPVTEAEKERSFEDIATNGRNADECVKKAYADPWDRSGKTELSDDRMADLTETHYEALKKIADDMELIRYQNGEIFPGDFDYENTEQYYEFYIEFENGKIMSGFSDDPEQCAKFKPIAEKFSEYYESYLDNNSRSE